MAAIIASVLQDCRFADKNRRRDEMRIGIPRGLLYYQYFPMWKTFFETLGAEAVVSPATTQEMLDQGCSRAVGDICLPV
jgi:predicted nucleotide-binding protein (sugar kinase/HSP70/actin superfamily)